MLELCLGSEDPNPDVDGCGFSYGSSEREDDEGRPSGVTLSGAEVPFFGVISVNINV